MRRHPDKECTGTHVFTETVGDLPEQRSEAKKRGSLFSIYIFKNRQWVKIGEYCSTCGFHFDEEQLSQIFGNVKQSAKTTLEVEAGKRVPYVYSHEFPRKFDFSLKPSQGLPFYPLACTNPLAPGAGLYLGNWDPTVHSRKMFGVSQCPQKKGCAGSISSLELDEKKKGWRHPRPSVNTSPRPLFPCFCLTP